MYEAGVWLIAICPETGSPRVMVEIQKKIDKNKNKQVIDWCRKIGIKTYVCFIFGFPFETLEDLKMSASFIESIGPDVIHITRALPIPGTPLYEKVASKHNKEDFMQEDGMLFGLQKIKDTRINSVQFSRMVKSIYRRFYFNPIKMFRLISMLPLRNLMRLFIYAILTKNI